MLKPFEPTDFDLLESWVTGPEMLFQFGGSTFCYPITLDQLMTYAAEHTDRRFYIGYTKANVAFSFGEIIPQDDNSVRLGRLLIGDESLRGRGLGKYFVDLLISESRFRFNASRIDLYVWDNNPAAIACYKKAGFDFIPIEPFSITFNDTVYNLLKMTLK